MIRKYLLPILAAAGAFFAFQTALQGSKPVPVAPPVAQPAQAPFPRFVAGAGIVETSSENVSVGTIVPGVVAEVHVTVGAAVKAGAPLFRIDDREARAALRVKETALGVARERLGRLQALPRPEDVPPLEARVRVAASELEDARALLQRWESVKDKRAVSEEELTRRRFAVAKAEARVLESTSELDQLKAGAWKPELAVAQAEVDAAASEVEAARVEVERRIVRAPLDGEVLQVKVRAGEYAPSGITAIPLVLMGRTHPLHVRVDVDENDAWRVRAGSRAAAFLRGNRAIRADLTFVRFEPYVIPKRSLTGDATERVDTRVLQVLFSFERGDLPIHTGQLMDVFIEVASEGAR
jgi:multidrug resistance efflux pump